MIVFICLAYIFIKTIELTMQNKELKERCESLESKQRVIVKRYIDLRADMIRYMKGMK